MLTQTESESAARSTARGERMEVGARTRVLEQEHKMVLPAGYRGWYTPVIAVLRRQRRVDP